MQMKKPRLKIMFFERKRLIQIMSQNHIIEAIVYNLSFHHHCYNQPYLAG